jgi:hypothetical protein
MNAANDPVALWASAQVTQLLDGQPDPPEYGSPAWRALLTADPRRAAAIITAAEHWRRDRADEAELNRLLDDDPVEWFRRVTAEADAEARRIAPALARRPIVVPSAGRRPVRARPIVATPGWPPVAIPGRPGWWRHHVADGRQIDLPISKTGAPAA